MLCKELMLSFVYTCHANDSAQHCAAIMREAKAGFVPVVDDEGRVIGVVTDRDLVVRLLAEGRPPGTAVAEAMTGTPFVSVAPEDDVRTAEERMAKEKKSRALVLDPLGRCEGIISLSDIAQREDLDRAGRLLREVSRRESVSISKA
jgi:CBS domain-containing protein